MLRSEYTKGQENGNENCAFCAEKKNLGPDWTAPVNARFRIRKDGFYAADGDSVCLPADPAGCLRRVDSLFPARGPAGFLVHRGLRADSGRGVAGRAVCAQLWK